MVLNFKLNEMKRLGVVILAGFILLLLLFFLCMLILSFFVLRINSKSNHRGLSEMKKYFERDHLLNETTFGFVSLLDKYEKGFYTFNDFTLRKEVLISPFGTEEYECVGSCYCENMDTSTSRRSAMSNNALMRGMTYLLAAVSSLGAIELASEHFDRKCEEKYSNICESMIQSDVEGCENLEADEDIFGNGRESDVESRTYFCYGNCLEKSERVHLPQDQECKKLKREGGITIYSDDVIKNAKDAHISTKMLYTARKRFQTYYLVDFCRESSRVEYEYEKVQERTMKTGGKKEYVAMGKRYGSTCTGIRFSGSRSHIQNVSCRQIDPEPSGKNSVWRDRVWWEKKREWDDS